jgi:hypothetical protein
MEYSTDFGATWIDYDMEHIPAFEGGGTILVRMKAMDGGSPGEMVTFTFIQNPLIPPEPEESDTPAASEESAVSIADKVPLTSDITITGNAEIGGTVTASYLYRDSGKDGQDTSLIQWYRADDAQGKDKKLIRGADALTYKLTKRDQDKYIICSITPAAETGISAEKMMTAITSDKVQRQEAAYKAHMKLGLAGNGKSAYELAKRLRDEYHGRNVLVNREASCYKVSVDFIDKEAAIRYCKELKAQKYITNYYIS